VAAASFLTSIHRVARFIPFSRFLLRISFRSWTNDHCASTTLSFSRAFRSITRTIPSRLPIGNASPLAVVNMAWFNRLNPTPSFPAHTGPYKVGSVDVEIPTSDLESPSAKAPPTDLPTVAFRVFYPCKQDSKEKAVRWIPGPQREYISAYAKFLGANSAFAGVFS
jgi:hypothetical protein